MKKLLVTLIALGFSGVAMAGISTEGAPHNFYDNACGDDANDYTSYTLIGCDETTAGWNDTGEICKVCHTPHMRNQTQWDSAQLWNHTLGADTGWTMYTDTFGTLDATPQLAPDGKSKLCLGCHDGVTALDAYGTHAATATTVIGDATMPYRAEVETGQDLGNSHPVSIQYADSAGVRADTDLHLITANNFDGAAVSTVLQVGADTNYYVQCTSCHEPHQDRTENAYLTRIPNTGSALCLACHNK